jgi:RNA-directed DNA polymerase
MMHGDEKSDPAIVAIRTNADGIHREKPANEGGQPPEELAEPRACPKRRLGVGAKGNAIEHGMRRTPGRENMSHGLDRVRQAARQKDERFTALLHHVDVELLGSAYGWLRKEASAGVDGVTWAEYGEGLEGKLTDLHDRIHRGTSSGYSNGYAVGTLASLAMATETSSWCATPTTSLLASSIRPMPNGSWRTCGRVWRRLP